MRKMGTEKILLLPLFPGRPYFLPAATGECGSSNGHRAIELRSCRKESDRNRNFRDFGLIFMRKTAFSISSGKEIKQSASPCMRRDNGIADQDSVPIHTHRDIPHSFSYHKSHREDSSEGVRESP